MQYVRKAGDDPAFLLKALGEASGELQRAFAGLGRRQLLQPAPAPDEGWCLMGIAYHVGQVERGITRQIEAILYEAETPEIPNVDLDDIPFAEDYAGSDADALLDELHYLRRRNTYTLWDMAGRAWERAGQHPYRGPLTVLQIVRETYQHDLEHLWQARRIVDQIAVGRDR